jgi:uncharacterized protein involved in tolerance to divalent cations
MIIAKVDSPEEAEHVIQKMFEKKLLNEASFQMQVQRTHLDSNNKIVVEGEGNVMNMVLITTDEKVGPALSEIEAGDVGRQGDIVVSPMLNGKRDYEKYVSESKGNAKVPLATEGLTD